ncbi:MAG: desulfoferrodoxin [Methanobrevibacter sp.]|uniref:desulfoferrodoxin n=1 Tax=Methanobrevibacter sp. TaxID=66852 RepID=UPI0026E09040|nr:desulfoferrodoxin [Methanobrevibacter sp.]MDO5849095.1 desulfoferrodoxin [Methanobrevibacter sp.]
MTERGQIYKCKTCGNVVEVLDNGVGELVCCNQPMTLLDAQTEGDKAAKHVPVVEVDGSAVFVKVGELQHPMEEEHSIRFIELIVGDERLIEELEPGELPEATFIVDEKVLAENDIVVREYCNLHGLWEN